MKTPLRVVPLLAVAAVVVGGCAHVKVDPIQVQTIHIVHDVNIRVDKQLDEFFAFQEQQAAAATQPASAPSTAPTAATTGVVQ
jgi:hypothetical protein